MSRDDHADDCPITTQAMGQNLGWQHCRCGVGAQQQLRRLTLALEQAQAEAQRRVRQHRKRMTVDEFFERMQEAIS